MSVYFLLSLILSLAHADPDKLKDANVVYKQKTEIDFEGIELEGHLIKPQGSLVIERKTAAFNPLIKLRTDFNHEMSLSVQEVK